MKQHIDTIPVWDAFKADCECPLCWLKLHNEAGYVESFLGASVMEPATRVEVNKKGFCLHHFRQMHEAGNRLGLALITHTYMKDTIAALSAQIGKDAPSAPKKSLFGGRGAQANPGSSGVEKLGESCILCERLENTMERYMYTLCYMWAHETEFKKTFENSKGFCIPHYKQLQKSAAQHIGGRNYAEFIGTLNRLELEHLRRVEGELEWFTLKFDYRNHDKPWGNSQDAVERSILKLRGQMALDPSEKPTGH